MQRTDFALVRFLVLSCTLTWLLGCGGGGAPHEVVPVSVTVTYEDGSEIPLGEGEYASVTFHPRAAETLEPGAPRDGTGTIGSGGKVEGISTYETDDGLVLGKHKVTVTATTMDASKKPIPEAYSDPKATPLEIDVTEAGQTFDLKIPKP